MNKLRIGLEWFLNPDHLPFVIAEKRGWFKEAGLEIELVEPSEHTDAAQLLAGRELDVAITEPLHLVEDAAKGREVIGFSRFLHTNGGVMTLARSGIERPRDLAGCRLQYPGAPGPGGPGIINTMVEADGGQPKTLNPVNLGFAHTKALQDNEADAAVLAFYNFEVVEAQHLGLSPRLFALKDWGVPDFCQLVLVATPQVLKDKADALRQLLKIMMRGMDAVQQEPEAVRSTYFAATSTPTDNPMVQSIFEATAGCFTFDMSMTAAYYERLATWMFERKLIETRPDLNRLWSNAWVQ